MSDISAPQFTNEKAAIAHLEASRWPDGVTCPHCGSDNVHRMGGETQAGMFQCNDCRDKFTARTGTVMERSHIPVHKWLLAIHLHSSQKGHVSAPTAPHARHYVQSRMVPCHRIREAMRDGKPTPMGGDSGIRCRPMKPITATPAKRAKHYKKGHSQKSGVVALVDPATGEARAFAVKSATAEKVRRILVHERSPQADLVTDESSLYDFVGAEYSEHQTVLHTAGKYVNKDGYTTNNVENFFGVFKKGMVGTYHFCGEQHLQRYLDEFSFRYSNRSGLGVGDVERAALALKGIEGKRLTYRRPN